MVYPTSNLPTASQPWGREIQKQLVNAQTTIAANEINNSARDVQLQANFNRVNAAAIKANDAITGLTSLGTSESLYDIYGDNITGGTITGTTVQTAASGSRVVLNGTTNQLEFYYGESIAATMQSTIYDSASTLWVNGNLWASGSLNTTNLSCNTINADSGTSIINDLAVLTNIDTDSLLVIGDSTFATGSFSGALFTDGPLYATGIAATGSISTDGNLNRTALVGGGTTGASFNTNGSLIRTTSSERYKQDITNLEVNYDDILLLNPRKFRLKEEVAENPDAREYAGFIAEEVEETSLKIFVAYETLPDGSKRPDGVYYSELTAALTAAIKHQDAMIKQLTARIEILENK